MGRDAKTTGCEDPKIRFRRFRGEDVGGRRRIGGEVSGGGVCCVVDYFHGRE